MITRSPHPATTWYRRRAVTDTALALVVAVLTATGGFGTNDLARDVAGAAGYSAGSLRAGPAIE